LAFDCWETQNRDDETHPSKSNEATWSREFAEIPWSRTEIIADKDDANGDRGDKRDILSNRTNGEDGANCHWTGKLKKIEQDADETIEPDYINSFEMEIPA
jgi:hypothetical protein